MGTIKIVLAALLLGINVWLAGAAFEPIVRDGRAIEYILVSPSFVRLFIGVAGAGAALLALQAFIFRRRAEARQPFLSSLNTRHLDVLGWMALSLVPLVNLFAPLSARLPALSYVLFDLRFYWWPLVLLGVLRAADVPLDPVGWLSAIPRWWVVTGLTVLSITSAVAFTPHLRFTGTLDGDEPKYLRYCENFYQGLGFDISKQRLLTELAGHDEPHVFENVRGFLRAVPEEASLLIDDARRLVGAAAAPRLVAEANMFFAGKHPGTVYQLHTPGLSFLLFPGYYLDRRVTGRGVGYQNEFPAFMPALYSTLLALYAGYALALYALLNAYSGNRALASILALIGVVTLPAGAFAFQVYPEVAAGLIFFVLVRELLVPLQRSNGVPQLLLGFLAGFLPWLHVRFGLASAVMVIWMLATHARPLRARLFFAAGAAVVLGAFLLYMYRLTGNFLPKVPYGPDEPLSSANVLNGVPGFAFDRLFGLFSHTPLYLLALTGVGLAWRRNRAIAWVMGLLAAVVFPAASHGFQAAGATPGRYLVAIAPLMLLFVAESMRRWSKRGVFVAVFFVFTLVSIETAVRYNLNHLKGHGPLVAKEFSGWRPNLLFPSVGSGPWPATPRDAVLLLSWSAIAALLIAVPWWSLRRSESVPDEAMPAMTSLRAPFGVLLVVAMLGLIVGAFTGEMMDRDYFVPPEEARDRVLATFADVARCALCYTSALGEAEPTISLGNDVAFVDLRSEPASPRAGEAVRVRVRPRSPSGEYVVTLMRLEFGDDSVATYRHWFGDVSEAHVYAQPGEYDVHAWVKASSPDPVETRIRVHVAP